MTTAFINIEKFSLTNQEKKENWYTGKCQGILTFVKINTMLAYQQVLSRWPLFGSSFFAVRRVSGAAGPGEWREHVLALNRRGVHLLEPATHETDTHWPYAELISTRKVCALLLA